jgi:nitrite reductase/ring-hydroxylating ferredoxin subunit
MTEQKASLKKIVSFMQEENDWVKSFEASSIGTYLPEDAMWNYKDAPHLNYVHSLAMGCQALISDNHVAALHTQKILGIRFPMTLVEYQSAPNELIYISTILVFTILVNTRITKKESKGQNTLVLTNYIVAGPWYTKPLFYIIKKIILNNYRILMSEDLPMRDRKAQLRKNEYAFLHDKTDHSWNNSLNIAKNNLILPCNEVVFKIDLNKEFINNGEYLLGENGIFGFRLVKKDDRFTLYPRICLHEGACIDNQKINHNEIISCPWHGRNIRPIAFFNNKSTLIKSDLKFFRVYMNESILSVEINTKAVND